MTAMIPGIVSTMRRKVSSMLISVTPLTNSGSPEPSQKGRAVTRACLMEPSGICSCPSLKFLAGSACHERIQTFDGTCSQCEALEVFQRILKKDEKLSIVL